jgi:hypothetical protein
VRTLDVLFLAEFPDFVRSKSWQLTPKNSAGSEGIETGAGSGSQ